MQNGRFGRSAFFILTSAFKWSVNAKQLEQPVFQAGPSRCESGHGRQGSAEFRVKSAESSIRIAPCGVD